MADQNLTTRVSIEGAPEAVRSLEGVRAAQEGVAADQTKHASALEAATKAQNGLNQSSGVYVSMASRISPRLGQLAGILEGMVRTTTDLAKVQFTLRGAFQAVADGVRQYASAIKLALAGGAVVAAFSLLAKKIRGLTEEWKAAKEAAQTYQQKQTEILTQQREQRESLATAALQRREGGLQRGEERRARITTEAVTAAGFSEAVGQQVALLLPGLDRPEQIDAARLIESGRLDIVPQQRPESRMERFRRARDRHRDMLDRERERARERDEEARQARSQELMKGMGAAPELVRRGVQDFGMSQEEAERAVDIARDLAEAERRIEAKWDRDLYSDGARERLLRQELYRAGVERQGGGWLERLMGTNDITSEDVARARQLVGGNVTVNNYGTRNYIGTTRAATGQGSPQRMGSN